MKLLDHVVLLFFNFLKDLHALFCVGCFRLYPHQQCTWIPFPQHPHQPSALVLVSHFWSTFSPCPALALPDGRIRPAIRMGQTWAWRQRQGRNWLSWPCSPQSTLRHAGIAVAAGGPAAASLEEDVEREGWIEWNQHVKRNQKPVLQRHLLDMIGRFLNCPNQSKQSLW